MFSMLTDVNGDNITGNIDDGSGNNIRKELAEKIGTKKTYISRLENGKADIQLSTLFRIFEGLGRRVSLTIL